MSRWTSSLRLGRDSLAVGACLAAFACPQAGWAAGGTPMPAPDDPPGGFATSSSKPTRPSTATDSSKQARVVPTPDAPVVGSSAAPVATKPRVVVRTATATPSPAVSRPSSPASAPRPVVTSTTPSRTARAVPKPSPKPRPAPTRKAKAKPKPAHTATKHATASAAATPRDAVRFGLPAAVLSARDSGGTPRAALLVAAALLLAVAAGGSTVLGVAARSATRQA